MNFWQILAIFLAPFFVLQLIQTWRIIKMSQATDQFNAALTKLTTDVAALVAQGATGQQAAVDAFATQATVTVQQADNAVVAALTPPAVG